MGLIEKVKLLFKVQKPLGEVASAMKDAKKGWKTLSFWITLVGSLVSCVAALQGLIPAGVAVMISTGLTTLYNLLRGLQKVENENIPGAARTSEFWVGMLGILQTGLLELQTKGAMDDKWLVASLAVIAGGMASAQSMAGSKPALTNEEK